MHRARSQVQKRPWLSSRARSARSDQATVITVAGGVYQERCITPDWHQLYGSGGRAAAALTSFGSVELHTYIGSPDVRSLLALAAAVGFKVLPIETSETIGFFYFHPLSVPVINPTRVPSVAPLVVDGETILRFGMLEGDAVVHGRRVVYDLNRRMHRSPLQPIGSRADSLAIVLNRQELALSREIRNLESAAVGLYAARTRGCRGGQERKPRSSRRSGRWFCHSRSRVPGGFRFQHRLWDISLRPSLRIGASMV